MDLPRSRSSAFCALTTVGASEPSAILTLANFVLSVLTVTTAAALATEMLIAFLLPSFSKLEALIFGINGIQISRINESARNVVAFGPEKKSAILITLSPLLQTVIKLASSAINGGMKSPAGDAVARFPPI